MRQWGPRLVAAGVHELVFEDAHELLIDQFNSLGPFAASRPRRHPTFIKLELLKSSPMQDCHAHEAMGATASWQQACMSWSLRTHRSCS